MKIVLATCDALGESDNFDKLVTSFVSIYIEHNKIISLLKTVISKEVFYTGIS